MARCLIFASPFANSTSIDREDDGWLKTLLEQSTTMTTAVEQSPTSTAFTTATAIRLKDGQRIAVRLPLSTQRCVTRLVVPVNKRPSIHGNPQPLARLPHRVPLQMPSTSGTPFGIRGRAIVTVRPRVPIVVPSAVPAKLHTGVPTAVPKTVPAAVPAVATKVPTAVPRPVAKTVTVKPQPSSTPKPVPKRPAPTSLKPSAARRPEKRSRISTEKKTKSSNNNVYIYASPANARQCTPHTSAAYVSAKDYAFMETDENDAFLATLHARPSPSRHPLASFGYRPPLEYCHGAPLPDYVGEGWQSQFCEGHDAPPRQPLEMLETNASAYIADDDLHNQYISSPSFTDNHQSPQLQQHQHQLRQPQLLQQKPQLDQQQPPVIVHHHSPPAISNRQYSRILHQSAPYDSAAYKMAPLQSTLHECAHNASHHSSHSKLNESLDSDMSSVTSFGSLDDLADLDLSSLLGWFDERGVAV